MDKTFINHNCPKWQYRYPKKFILRPYQLLIAKSLHFPIFAPAGLARPAPAELPQDRKVARVGGCSGAM